MRFRSETLLKQVKCSSTIWLQVFIQFSASYGIRALFKILLMQIILTILGNPYSLINLSIVERFKICFFQYTSAKALSSE